MTINELGTLLSGLGSIGILILGVVIYFQGKRVEKQGKSIHAAVNSLSDQRAAAAEQKGFSEGRTEGRLGRLENESDKKPNGPKT